MESGGNVDINILSDETFDLLCTMCKNQGKNTEAEKFCMDCNDYYCLPCVKVHSQVPLLMGHKVLDTDQVMSRSSQIVPMAPTQRCSRHSHKHIDMYCQNHDDVGCSTCMAVDHRLCKDIFYIPEFIQNNQCTVTPRDTKLKLEAVSKTLIEQNDKFEQEKQSLMKRKCELLDKIKTFREEINDRLDELEKCSVDEIEDKFKVLVTKSEEVMKQVQAINALVISAKEKLSYAQSNMSEVFVNVKMGENVASNAGTCIEDNQMRTKVGEIDFTAAGEILSVLLEVNALGKLTERIDKNVEYEPTDTIQQKNPILQIRSKETYCIRAQSDRNTCDIVSICAIEDGTIILADYNNHSLKRLSSSTFTVINYFKLPAVPWQLCPINEQQVAVSIPMKREVLFISVGNNMTKSNMIKTDFECFGLANVNNNLYLADESSSVYIYTVSGRKLKQISKDQFSDIRGLAVAKDASKIYVTDFDKGLIVLSNNGLVVGNFNDKLLQGAFDCYLTETGNVLVCGNNSKNVLQFGPNGELIGEVLKLSGEYKGPRASCCFQQMSKIIIGMFRDYIEVFELM